MKRWIFALLLAALSMPALAAGRLAQVDIVDAATGRVLPFQVIWSGMSECQR